MDLAVYVINAVLVEGRSVEEVFPPSLEDWQEA